MNYCPVTFGQVTDGKTEYDAYEPTVHGAQVGSKMQLDVEDSTLASNVTD